MSGDAHVNVSGAHTGNNVCGQGATSTGGHGGLDVTAVPALLNLQSGSITINPNMSGFSAFHGNGPMVTGGNNHFGLQNLDSAASYLRDGVEGMATTPDWAFELQNLDSLAGYNDAYASYLNGFQAMGLQNLDSLAGYNDAYAGYLNGFQNEE